jgi:hypothetical protein
MGAEQSHVARISLRSRVHPRQTKNDLTSLCPPSTREISLTGETMQAKWNECWSPESAGGKNESSTGYR